MHSIYLLPSLDGDPGVTMSNSHLRKLAPERWIPTDEDQAQQQYRAAVLELFTIFDHHGLTGKVTWFLNERDVQWTQRFPDLLQTMKSRRDEIALHTHFGGLFGSPILDTIAATRDACLQAKHALENFTGEPCLAHRSGCFYQSSITYEGIQQAGFHVLSDVNPGRKTIDAEGRMLDNSDIPFETAPGYRSYDVIHAPLPSRLGFGLGSFSTFLRAVNMISLASRFHGNEELW